MLIAVDIGNSSTKFGLFDDAALNSRFSIPTKRDATPDEIRFAVGDRVPKSAALSIVCSVVPGIQRSIEAFLLETTGTPPTVVDNTFDFGLKIDYEPPESLGTDRLVAAYAAADKYGTPCIVCSLGTATTIGGVTADRKFVGGIIAPGLDAMAEALHIKAPRLPKNVDIRRPETVSGSSTEGSIRSGIYFGYVSMVEGLIERIKAELGPATVIATGGASANVADEIALIDVIDPDLILHGLYAIARR